MAEEPGQGCGALALSRLALWLPPCRTVARSRPSQAWPSGSSSSWSDAHAHILQGCSDILLLEKTSSLPDRCPAYTRARAPPVIRIQLQSEPLCPPRSLPSGPVESHHTYPHTHHIHYTTLHTNTETHYTHKHTHTTYTSGTLSLASMPGDTAGNLVAVLATRGCS